MKKRIFIFSNGELRRKENTLYFENEEGKRKYVPVENTAEMLIFGEVSVNKKLLEFLTQKEIILHFFNHYGYYVGSYYPREHYNSGYMILKQAEYYMNTAKRLEIAKAFITGAVANILKCLMYYNNRGVDLNEIISNIKELSGSLNEVCDVDQLMAIEGNIRNIYYESFDKITANDDFLFGRRTRQPPKNRINALISFGNTLLYTLVLSQIYQTHLDPRIGFLHSTNFRRFTLNLDVAEVFKPIIVDRAILTLINKRELKASHFANRLNGVYLNEKGRKIFVENFENRLKATIKHKKLKRQVSYRRLIRLELYKLEKHLIGEEKYKPYITAW